MTETEIKSSQPTHRGRPSRAPFRRSRPSGSPRPQNRSPLRRPRPIRDRDRTGDHGTVPTEGLYDRVRIIPLGGVEEVGKNMTVVEYKDSIIIVDMGFQFPDEESMPGVDYIIPDISYLIERKDKIRAVFITHGHLDHIGGIPYIMDRLGNPPIFTRLLTSIMIQKRQEEFPHLPKLNINIIEKDTRLVFGDQIGVRCFYVTHTIPDAMGIIIETLWGNIIFTGDLKVDHNEGIPLAHEVQTFGALGREKNLLLLADSTNIERPGWSFSERVVHENIVKIIKETDGRLIVGTFASLLERIIFIMETAEKLGKKVVIEGRSMQNNIAIARELGILKVQDTTIVSAQDSATYPDSKIIVLATGAQGDRYAALMRMAQKEHKTMKLRPGDTVLLSSSVIPGNEKDVQRLKDNLARQGARILHYRVADVHSSGHANADETRWIHQEIKPRFFVPVHGYHQFLRVHAELASEVMPKSHIVVPDNGSVIEIVDNGSKIVMLPKKVSAESVMVDAIAGGDINEIVIRDRKLLAQEGMFVIIASVEKGTGRVRQSPDIISRGFIYLKESQELLRTIRALVRKTIEKSVSEMHPVNFDFVKNTVRDKVSKTLFQETGKRPIVIPVLLEV
ncbi:MAG: ribonuclease J [Candidatus Vogelbacteria bacterium]|nr:ribonuclease J [Candidatus Vogelbacteria bacterium]